MKRIFLWAVLIGALLCAWRPTASAELATAGVNWENEVVTAVGYGAPSDKAKNPGHARMLAHQAAMLDGFRRLAEQASGIHITAESTISDNISTGDIVAGEVNAVIKRAKVVSETYDEYGNCTVVMEVPLYGVTNSIAKVALKPVAQSEPFPEPTAEPPSAPPSQTSVNVNVDIHNTPATPSTPITPSAPSASTTPAPPAGGSSAAPVPASAAGMSAVGNYTGLIVDCTGLGLRPVMSPVIKNADGTPIYGYKNLDSAKVIANGMAGYANGMSGRTTRAGARPLVVKAVALENHNGNPIVSVADANRILVENQATHFLDNCAVVFVR